MFTPVRIAALLLPVAVLAGCASDAGTDTAGGGLEPAAADSSPSAPGAEGTEGAEGTGGTEGDCAAVDGTLLTADAAPGEPTLKIPQPDGWEVNTQLNSELVRLAVVNPGISREEFAPNVVVTAEPSPVNAQAAFDLQLAAVTDMLGVSEMDSETGTVCGYESMTLDYVLPAMGGVPERPAVARFIVVPNGDEAITYTLTAQATAPTDPSYEQDVETIISGVQISG